MKLLRKSDAADPAGTQKKNPFDRYFLTSDEDHGTWPVSVRADRENPWLYVNWHGHQNCDSVRKGCEYVLEKMALYKIFDILNDNTNVRSIWPGISVWLAGNWFPRMIEAGMKRFAWVHNPDAELQVSTDTTVALLDWQLCQYVRTFSMREDAQAWLQSPAGMKA